MKSEIMPVKAIMVYDCETESDKFDYMEMIDYENGEPIKSYPLPEEFLQKLAKNYLSTTQTRFNFSLLRESSESLRIIGFDYRDERTVMYFYSPPMVTNLYFAKGLDVKSGKYPIPALIWKASLTSLSVWAVTDKYEELNADTILYMAPFMNTSSDGVCLGSTKMPETVQNNLEYTANRIVESFFESKFTHFGNPKITKSNFYTLWNSLKDQKSYPNEELVEFSTLKEKLRELL